jgi:hypothetical protein
VGKNQADVEHGTGIATILGGLATSATLFSTAHFQQLVFGERWHGGSRIRDWTCALPQQLGCTSSSTVLADETCVARKSAHNITAAAMSPRDSRRMRCMSQLSVSCTDLHNNSDSERTGLDCAVCWTWMSGVTFCCASSTNYSLRFCCSMRTIAVIKNTYSFTSSLSTKPSFKNVPVSWKETWFCCLCLRAVPQGYFDFLIRQAHPIGKVRRTASFLSS